MAKWIQNHCERFFFNLKALGNNSGSSTYEMPDINSLDTALAIASRKLLMGQWQIKAVVPLTASETYTYTNSGSDWAYGMAYGVAPIIGFVVFAQREIQVSDEEYESRMDAYVSSERLAALEKQLPKLRQDVQKDRQEKMEIAEKKSLFGKMKYIFNDTSYETREEAERMLEIMKASCRERAETLEKMEMEFENLSLVIDKYRERFKDI